jgi:hypothetical protein
MIVRRRWFISLALQRSAGRGTGRGAVQQKATSPRPSPPTSLAEREIKRRGRLRIRCFLSRNRFVAQSSRLRVPTASRCRKELPRRDAGVNPQARTPALQRCGSRSVGSSKRNRKLQSNFQVCGFTGHSGPVVLATGKSPQPAGWKACATVLRPRAYNNSNTRCNSASVL